MNLAVLLQRSSSVLHAVKAAEQHSWTSRTSQATYPVAGHIALAAFQQHSLKSITMYCSQPSPFMQTTLNTHESNSLLKSFKSNSPMFPRKFIATSGKSSLPSIPVLQQHNLSTIIASLLMSFTADVSTAVTTAEQQQSSEISGHSWISRAVSVVDVNLALTALQQHSLKSNALPMRTQANFNARKSNPWLKSLKSNESSSPKFKAISGIKSSLPSMFICTLIKHASDIHNISRSALNIPVLTTAHRKSTSMLHQCHNNCSSARPCCTNVTNIYQCSCVSRATMFAIQQLFTTSLHYFSMWRALPTHHTCCTLHHMFCLASLLQYMFVPQRHYQFYPRYHCSTSMVLQMHGEHIFNLTFPESPFLNRNSVH